MSTISLLSAFLIGVILFNVFRQDWLALDSIVVFLAGLTGVGVAVLAFGIASILRNSRHK